MNAIKNTIVTVTLLIVGYGAYKVLKDPHPNSLDEDLMSWDATMEPSAMEEPPTDLSETETHVTSTQRNDLISRMRVATGEPVGNQSASGQSQQGQTSNAQELQGDFADNSATYDDSFADDNLTEPVESLELGSHEAEVIDDGGAIEAELANSDSRDLVADGDYGNDAAIATSDVANQQNNFYDRSSDNLNPPNLSNEIPSNDIPSDDQFEIAWESANAMLEKGQLADALFHLTDIYQKSQYDSTQATRLIPLLDKLAGTIIYSADSYLEPAYQIQANESIQDIAKQHSLTPDFVARINAVAPDYQPVSGETLKVVRGPFNAVLDRNSNELTVYLGAYYAGRFAVKLGPELPTGAATYQVSDKQPGREFFDKRSGFRVPVGDSQNPYGNYWIGLRGQQVTSGHNVGIHASSSDNVSCIGVNPTDADDLTAILSIGSKIVVTR